MCVYIYTDISMCLYNFIYIYIYIYIPALTPRIGRRRPNARQGDVSQLRGSPGPGRRRGQVHAASVPLTWRGNWMVAIARLVNKKNM